MWLAQAVSGSFADTPACCQVVSTIVPPLAILVDLGMPAVLLTIAYYTLRYQCRIPYSAVLGGFGS